MLLWGTLVALGLCAAAASGAPKLQAWTVSCTQKVYPTTLLASQPGSAELYLARGEYEAIQVAVRSDQDVADCRVSIQPQGGASGTISSDWFDVFEASYVPTPADKEHKLTPDPLVPLKKRAGAYHVSLKADETKAIWIRFHAPESGPSGRFRVRVSLEAAATPKSSLAQGDGGSAAVEFAVTVWPFVLPRVSHVRTAFGIWGGLAELHGVKTGTPEYEELYKKYYDELLRHRICAYNVPYGIMDPRALPYLRSPRVNSFVVPYTEEDDKLAQMWEYLRAVGAAHKAWVYPLDEPVNRDAYEQLKHRAAFVRRVAPGLKVCSPFYRGPDWDEKLTPFDELIGVLDIWCANTGYYSRKDIQERMKERQQAGEEAWVYVCCGPGHPFCNFFVNMAALQHRMLGWQLYRYELDGLLYWSTTYWNPRDTKNPFEDIATVKDINPNIYGDGSLFYPGSKVGIDGPVTSIRLECIRDGLEDYEYLVLAERALSKAEAMKIAQEATPTLVQYITDPAEFGRVRRALGEALAQAATRQ